MAHQYQPTERVRIYFPSRMDGSGMATMECQAGTADFFRLWDLPKPTDPAYVEIRPDGSRWFRGRPPGRLSVTRYRIAWGTPWPCGKQRSAAFSLGKRHTKQTLQVIINHLDATGVPWLYLCNGNGSRNRLWSFESRVHAV